MLLQHFLDGAFELAVVARDVVFGRVIDIMQSYGDICHAQTRCQMPGVYGYFLDNITAQLIAELGQFVDGKLAQILWGLDLI